VTWSGFVSNAYRLSANALGASWSFCARLRSVLWTRSSPVFTFSVVAEHDRPFCLRLGICRAQGGFLSARDRIVSCCLGRRYAAVRNAPVLLKVVKWFYLLSLSAAKVGASMITSQPHELDIDGAHLLLSLRVEFVALLGPSCFWSRGLEHALGLSRFREDGDPIRGRFFACRFFPRHFPWRNGVVANFFPGRHRVDEAIRPWPHFARLFAIRFRRPFFPPTPGYAFLYEPAALSRPPFSPFFARVWQEAERPSPPVGAPPMFLAQKL